MFKKIVAIEPVNLIPAAQQKLREYAAEAALFDGIGPDAQLVALGEDGHSIAV